MPLFTRVFTPKNCPTLSSHLAERRRNLGDGDAGEGVPRKTWPPVLLSAAQLLGLEKRVDWSQFAVACVK